MKNRVSQAIKHSFSLTKTDITNNQKYAVQSAPLIKKVTLVAMLLFM